MSSSCMISNDLRINNINPFLNDMPGTWNDPYTYNVSDTIHKEAPAQWDNTEPSPLCEVALTAGDNTLSMCRPREPNCPMERFQEPRRLYDPGMWTYYNADQEKKTKNNYQDQILLIILIISIIIVFLVNQG